MFKRWVNFYPPCDTLSDHPWRTTSWISRELADKNAKPGRIACVLISFLQGDGLKREPELCGECGEYEEKCKKHGICMSLLNSSRF